MSKTLMWHRQEPKDSRQKCYLYVTFFYPLILLIRVNY